MFYFLNNTSTCSSLVEEYCKLVLGNFEVYFIVAVFRYFATTDVAYLDWSTRTELYLCCNKLTNITQCVYTGKFKWNIFPIVYTNTRNIQTLNNTSTCSSLVEEYCKLVLGNFEVYFIVAVFRYFATTDVAYLDWSTRTELYLCCNKLTNITQCVYTGKFKWNIFPIVYTNNFPS